MGLRNYFADLALRENIMIIQRTNVFNYLKNKFLNTKSEQLVFPLQQLMFFNYAINFLSLEQA